MYNFRRLNTYLLLLIFIIPLVANGQAQRHKPSELTDKINIEDFNNGLPGVNLLNQDTGTFEAPGNSQGNSIKQNYLHITDTDWALQLDYNVNDNSGSVGYWTRLIGLNLSNTWKDSKIVFYIKGDSSTGYTNSIKIDIKTKNGNESVSTKVGGITDNWQKKEIPLKRFTKINSWKQMYELVFVFSANDLGKNPLKGTIYIDNISIR